MRLQIGEHKCHSPEGTIPPVDIQVYRAKSFVSLVMKGAVWAIFVNVNFKFCLHKMTTKKSFANLKEEIVEEYLNLETQGTL